MSGGSYSYVYCKVENECVGRMFDRQLDEMMKQSENSKRNGSNKLRLMYKNKLNQSLNKQKMSY